MLKNKLILLTQLTPALALLSCAAPKAVVVEEAPVSKQETAQQTTAAETEPTERGLPDDPPARPPQAAVPEP